MNRIKIIFALLIVASTLASLVSCNTGCDHAYHNDKEWIVTKEPDCFNEGEAYNVCFKCGEKVVLPVQKLEHDFDAPVIHEPTCTEEGKMTMDCPLCGMKVISDKKPALGHDFKDGVCTRCGAVEGE